MSLPKLLLSPFQALDTAAVELRNGQRDRIRHILIENTHHYGRKRGECQVEERDEGKLEQVGYIELAVALVPEDGERPDHVLVEEIGNGLRHSPVRPTAVYQDKSLEESELANGIVC